MRKLHNSHRFSCDVDTYWKAFFHEDYGRKFYMEEMGFKAYETLEQTDDKRILRVVPKLNMPKPVMKLLGDSFGYEEHGHKDADGVWHWKIVPNKMADKLSTFGTIKIEADGDGCKRTDECSVEAKIFGVGKLFETSTESEVRNTWAADTRFMERWLRDNA